MIFKLVDENNQTVIQTKVKVSLNTFILTNEIYDSDYLYIDDYISDIRNEYKTKYKYCNYYQNEEDEIYELENELVNELKVILKRETDKLCLNDNKYFIQIEEIN